jgi:hypothetical protein
MLLISIFPVMADLLFNQYDDVEIVEIGTQLRFKSISQITAVQRQVVCFATGDYRRTNSVTGMMKQLNLTPLERPPGHDVSDCI